MIPSEARARETLAKLAAATRSGRVRWSRTTTVPADDPTAECPGSLTHFASEVADFRWTVGRYSPAAGPDVFQVWLERVREATVEELQRRDGVFQDDRGGHFVRDFVFTTAVEDATYDEEALEALSGLWEAAYQSATGIHDAFDQVNAVLDAAA